MTLLFAYPENKTQAGLFAKAAGYELGELESHRFPDGESLVRLRTSVENRDVMLFCSLDHPDNKAMPLLFFAQTARDLGAKSVGLIAPYLGYMRQDKQFHSGEAVTSDVFAAFLSQHFDSLTTVDPHLHRHKAMSEIYSIPTCLVHSSRALSQWIKNNIASPVLIGPDEESQQWVSEVANDIGAPYLVLSKIRHGDNDVEVSIPNIENYAEHTPVLIDDIISTARTMIETVQHLQNANMRPSVCIGVHAIFAGDAYEALKATGVEKIITCNTIFHETNAIDLNATIAHSIKENRPLLY